VISSLVLLVAFAKAITAHDNQPFWLPPAFSCRLPCSLSCLSILLHCKAPQPNATVC